MSIISVKNDALSRESVATSFIPVPPTISGYTVTGTDDLALDPAGGQAIEITGTGFLAGATITINGSVVAAVTYVNSNSLTFTSSAVVAGTYTIYAVNPDGGTAIYIPGLIYSNLPTWVTAAGSLASIYEYSPVSNTVAATGDGSVSYSLYSGTLPPGSTLNSSTGIITGTSPASATATTYSFVIRATDAQLQDSVRTFSITVNTDVVTWSTPADNSTSILTVDEVAATTTLLATSAAGKAITYTANTLPTGLSISGATVIGTPTAIASTASTFTATAADTNKTATRTINWSVVVASDLYFPYTTLLLSSSAATATFVTDASTNNFALTIAGDTKPNNFNPYTPGYYSNYFNGSSNFTSSTSQIVPTGSFTVECWVYVTSTANQAFVAQGTNANAARFSLAIESGLWWTQIGNTSINIGTPIINTWNYIAVTFNGFILTLYVNGISIGTTSTSTSAQNTTLVIGTLGPSWGSGYFVTGYISNVRVSSVVRTIVTPTAPYTSDASTRLLTCQSNRFLDNSSNAFALTITGTPSVQSSTPFVPNTAYAAYGSTYFDGTGDYLTTPSNAAFQFGTDDFTVEYWINFTTTPGASSIVPLSCWSSNSGWELYYRSVGTVFAWYYNSTFLAGTTVPKPNTWYHLAVTRSSATTRLFVNGAIEATLNSDTTNFTPSSALYIGNESGTSNFFTGYVSNVRIVKGTAVYTSAFTPPTAPLTAITNTSLLTLQTNQPVNNNVFLDNSTNAFAVTRNGSTIQGTFSPYGANWSIYQSDAVTPILGFTTSVGTSFQFTGDFTIEGWVYYTSLSGDASFYVISNGSTYLALNISMSAAVYNIYLNSGSPTSSFAHGISVGTWAHIAMVRSGSTVTLYTNGVSKGTITNSSTLGYSAPSINRTSGGNGVIRYISNIRVVKGTAVYTSAFTPSTTPLTAITNTQLLTCQSNRFVDNSSNAFIATITGSLAIQRFSPFNPSTVYTASTTGGSTYFDGAGDYLTVASNTAFDIASGNFTIEGWVYFPGAPTAFALATRGVYVSVYSFFAGNAAAALTSLFWEVGTGAWAATPYTSSAGALVGGQWNHIAYVRNSTSFYMYANGVRVFSQVITTISANVTAPLWIGSYYNQNTILNGNMADFRFVKGTALYTGATYTIPTAPLTAITNTSLLLNMTSAGVYDSASMINLEIVGDAKRVSTHTPYAGSYYSNYFDGTGDYLSTTVNLAIATGPFTMEAWVYLTALGTERTILNNLYWQNGNNGGWYLTTDSSNRVLLRASTNTFNSRPTIILSSSTLAANTWTHVAVVRDSNNLVSMYFNGISAATAVTYAASLNQGTGQLFRIGAWTPDGSAQDFWLGYISNARVVTGAAVYTSTFTPPTTPLTAIANTSLLTCQSNRFIDNSTNAFAITKYGDTAVQSFNPFQRNSGTSMSFDGTGDYLSVPYNTAFNFGTASFTIESWVYFTTSGTAQCIVSTYYSGLVSASATGYEFLITSTNFLAFDTFIPNSNQTITATNNALVINSWNHVAIVNNAGTFNLYVNGVQCTKTGTMTQAVNSKSPSSAFTVGLSLYSPYNHPTTGYINDLRITNGIARYTATFTPPSLSFLTK